MKLKKIIREFVDNNQSGLNWLNDVDPNIFYEYKLIILDRPVTELEFSKILSDARKYPVSNISSWELNVPELNNLYNNDTSYIRIDEDNDLLLGRHFQQVIDNYQEKEVINISDLFSGNLKESEEEWGWANFQVNPFISGPLVVLFIDRPISTEEAKILLNLCVDAGYIPTDFNLTVNSVSLYSKNQSEVTYIKTFTNGGATQRLAYGHGIDMFNEYKYYNLAEDLKGMNYIEFNIDQVLPKNLTESENNPFEWMLEDIETPLIEYKNLGYSIENIVGFKVRISEDSEFYDENDGGNPIEEVGTVEGDNGDRNLPIVVRWPGKRIGGSIINSYNWEDLILVNKGDNLTEANEPTGLEWIEDIVPPIPAKDLKPKDRFMIFSIEGKSFNQYMRDPDLKTLDPYKTIFIMDDEGCFITKSSEQVTKYSPNVKAVWLQEEGNSDGGWVSVEGIMVTLLPNKKGG
jgi:hypothetical protein